MLFVVYLSKTASQKEKLCQKKSVTLDHKKKPKKKKNKKKKSGSVSCSRDDISVAVRNIRKDVFLARIRLGCRHAGIERGERGSAPPPPLQNHKAIGMLSNTDPDPLESISSSGMWLITLSTTHS